MGAEVAILIAPKRGVSGVEVRLETGRLDSPEPFRFVGGLWPVLQALDEAIRCSASQEAGADI